MRIIQQFNATHEVEFMAAERRFAGLEARRPDYPNDCRLQPVAAVEPCNTLIWGCEFSDLETARKTPDRFHGDQEHEALLEKQFPY